MSNSSEKITRVVSARRRATRWPVTRFDIVETATTVAVFGSRRFLKGTPLLEKHSAAAVYTVGFLAPWMVGLDIEAAFEDGRKVVIVYPHRAGAATMRASFVVERRDLGHLWTQGRLPKGLLSTRLVEALGLSADVRETHENGFWHLVGRRPTI